MYFCIVIFNRYDRIVIGPIWHWLFYVYSVLCLGWDHAPQTLVKSVRYARERNVKLLLVGLSLIWLQTSRPSVARPNAVALAGRYVQHMWHMFLRRLGNVFVIVGYFGAPGTSYCTNDSNKPICRSLAWLFHSGVVLRSHSLQLRVIWYRSNDVIVVDIKHFKLCTTTFAKIS